MKIFLSLIISLTISLQNMAQITENSIHENSKKYINLIETNYYKEIIYTNYQYKIETISLDTNKQLLILGISSPSLLHKIKSREQARSVNSKKPPYILALIDLSTDSIRAILDISIYPYEGLFFTKDYIVGNKSLLDNLKTWKQTTGNEGDSGQEHPHLMGFKTDKNSNTLIITYPSRCLGQYSYEALIELDF